MSKIVEIEYFRDSVKSLDFFAVKSVLADMIKRTKGNRADLEEAIRYAKDRGAFDWEAHDNHEATTNWNNINDKYNFEKERLVQNFSKVRYERVLKILEEILMETKQDKKEVLKSPSVTRDNTTENTKRREAEKKPHPQVSAYKKKKDLPVGIIVAGIAILVLGVIVITRK